MMTFPPTTAILIAAALASGAQAHVVAWSKGMYCKNDFGTKDAPNAAVAAYPLWNMTYNEWFLHGQCRNFPPPDGEFLNIPANGNFTVEISANRANTFLSNNGAKATDWPDGKAHPDNWSTNVTDPAYPPSSAGCISSPNIHAHGPWDAAGTAFAISYNNDITKVNLSDFTVFTVLPNTPYKRVATYQVPNLPACPAGGCLCAWGWIPNHCGTSNMYMHPYKCQVTGASAAAKAVGKAVPAVWCEDDQTKCIVGPKQFTAVYQFEGNNVIIPGGVQKDRTWPSPGYNTKMGFNPGAQKDIFSNVAAPVTPNTCPAATTVTVTQTVTATAKATRRNLDGDGIEGRMFFRRDQ